MLRVKGGPKITTHTSFITGQLGKDTGRFGLFHYGAYEYGSINEIGFDEHGVYQMRHCKEGYIAVKCRWPVVAPQEATPKRLAVWAKYRQAILEWQGLTQEEKATYNERVKGTRLNGCNLYVKEYLLSH